MQGSVNTGADEQIRAVRRLLAEGRA